MTYDGFSRDQLVERIEVLEFELGEIRGEVLLQPWGLRMPRTEFIILNCLAARAPRTVTKQGLLTAVYPSHDQPAIKIIDVWVCRIRKHLCPLGLSVETDWGRGYGMSADDGALWSRWCRLRTDGQPIPSDYPSPTNGAGSMTKQVKPLDWGRLIALQEAKGVHLVQSSDLAIPSDWDRAKTDLKAAVAELRAAPPLKGYHAVKARHDIEWPHKKRDRRIAKTYAKLRNFAATSRAHNIPSWTVKDIIKRRFPDLIISRRRRKT